MNSQDSVLITVTTLETIAEDIAFEQISSQTNDFTKIKHHMNEVLQNGIYVRPFIEFSNDKILIAVDQTHLSQTQTNYEYLTQILKLNHKTAELTCKQDKCIIFVGDPILIRRRIQ